MREEGGRSGVEIGGAPLAFPALRALAGGPADISIPAQAMERVRAGRARLEAAMAGGQPVYGATTGVGAMKDTEHHGAAIAAFNAGLHLAHHFAVGEPTGPGIARLTVALRLNTALSGRVGVSAGFVQCLAAMLEHDLLPLLPQRGSVGCADLGQMGALAAAMTGEGTVTLGGAVMPAREAFARCGLLPYAMRPRESLAAVASNAFGLARAADATARALCSIRQAMGQAAVTAAAWGLDRSVWTAAGESLVPGEPEMARWLIAATAAQTDWPARGSVHDPLSGRFIVQVIAPVIRAAEAAADGISLHSAQVDDNPVIVGDQVVTSGASYLGALTLDLAGLQLALAHLARNIFNRCLMLTGGLIPGLPVNLVPEGVVGTGYGPLMKLAQEQSVRISAAAAPVSPLNLTLAAGLEDEALLIPLIAERIEAQVEALDWLLTVEALVAVQALAQRGLVLQGLAARQSAAVRHHFAAFAVDVPLAAPLTALRAELTLPATRAAMMAISPFAPHDGRYFSPLPPPETAGPAAGQGLPNITTDRRVTE